MLMKNAKCLSENCCRSQKSLEKMFKFEVTIRKLLPFTKASRKHRLKRKVTIRNLWSLPSTDICRWKKKPNLLHDACVSHTQVNQLLSHSNGKQRNLPKKPSEPLSRCRIPWGKHYKHSRANAQADGTEHFKHAIDDGARKWPWSHERQKSPISP